MVGSPADFCSLTEAAICKRVHYQTVRRAISRGDLKALKVGGGVIIALEDLNRWHPHYENAPRRYRT
jgi:excisionase family DNA binding protein